VGVPKKGVPPQVEPGNLRDRAIRMVSCWWPKEREEKKGHLYQPHGLVQKGDAVEFTEKA